MKSPAFIIFHPASDSTPARAARLAGAVNWLPCTEGFADEMHGAVPPAAYRRAPGFGRIFALGEPFNHTAAGLPVYLWFRSKPLPACRLATVAEIDAELSEAALALVAVVLVELRQHRRAMR